MEAATRSRRSPLQRLRARLPRSAWILLAIALVLRLGVVGATVYQPLTLDSADFSRTALAISQTGTYPASNRDPWGGPSAFRPPAYPVLVAATYALAGEEAPPAAKALGALLGTLAAGLVGLIGYRIWGRRTGLIALGVAAVAPPMVVLSTALISEALFVPLTLGAVAAALEARRSARPLRWAALTGLLVGVAELTRTNAALLLLPLCIAVWTRRPRLRPRSLAAPALVVVTAVAAVAPWTIRNAIVLHAFVPVSTEIGYTIAGTYDQASRADRRWPAVWKEAEHGGSPEYSSIVFRAVQFHWDERQLGDRLQHQAIVEIKQHPAYVLEAGWWNAVRMFHLGELDFAVANLRDTDIPRWAALLEILGFYALAILAVSGAATRAAWRAPPWLWLVPLLLATTVFITGFIRFRAPIDPFLALLAAVGIAALPNLRRRSQPHAADSSRPHAAGSSGPHAAR